jgi:hypothetical protein
LFETAADRLADIVDRNFIDGLYIFYFVLNGSLNLHSHATGRVPACSTALDTLLIPDVHAVDVTPGSADFTTFTVQSIKCF